MNFFKKSLGANQNSSAVTSGHFMHELAHVVQYERLGGFHGFLKLYLQECINPGYPFGELEQDAKRAESAYL